MGAKGQAVYEELGFRKESLFPFMYGPYDHDVPKPRPPQDGNLRLLYVGRLDRHNKGLDLLLETVRALKRSDFTLDIVGGYGDLLSAVQEAAAVDKRIRFLGPWQPRDVVRNMSHYDVCVVPSRYDGWNVIANQAINAGLACVVSDGATSDELVAASGAGIVVPRANQRALDAAIQTVLDTPGLVEELKQAAVIYRETIAPESVGQYMVDVLRYSFSLCGGSGARPSCPWLPIGRDVET
jgi:glycosyltransferase involved in cell wall biosynthesis